MVSLKYAQLVALSTAVAALSTVDAAPRVHPGVHRALRRQASVNLMVTLKDSTKPIVNSVQEADHPTRGAKIEALVNRLKKLAETSQAEVTKTISQEAGSAAPLFSSAKSHWISNQISFQDASFELVEKLSVLPSIQEIREQVVLPPPDIKLLSTSTAEVDTNAVKNQWGVTKMQASDVWAAGYNGQGVVVGHIDTGVHFTHEALQSSFRGEYGWFDPAANTSEPYGDMYHGTMTLGLITGSHGIGAAPGAKWMSCRACSAQDGCLESYMLTCGEFMTCPTDTAGNNRDCSKAPALVSVSLGGTAGQTYYDTVIEMWRAVDIIPVFANGNNGTTCSLTYYPAERPDVISVGMTNRHDGLDPGSSRGPTLAGVIKPDISAPGSGVRSSFPFPGNNNYMTSTGTSLAAPFVSGVIALLLSAKPTLKYDDVRQILISTTDTANLADSGFACGNTSDTTFPNNQYGYGRINALKAYNLAANANATPVPTPPPTVCEGLEYDECWDKPICWWGESDECELAPPSSSSSSGSSTGATDPPAGDPTAIPTQEPALTPAPSTRS